MLNVLSIGIRSRDCYTFKRLLWVQMIVTFQILQVQGIVTFLRKLYLFKEMCPKVVCLFNESVRVQGNVMCPGVLRLKG